MKITRARSMLVLDFDIENRPLSYWREDRPTADITAIAYCWTHDPPSSVEVWLQGKDDTTRMLKSFVEAYNQADMVTGHYIRGHDLKIINAALVENGLPSLGPKLTQDTLLDLVKWSDLPKSQEHLIEMLGISGGKMKMSQASWREANRLTDAGLKLTEKRVASDVKQHIKLRAELIKRGLLSAPKVWRG